MNIENNAQQIPPTINGTYVQGNSNTRSVAVIVLTILLLITLFIFGAYIYFKEVYETERVSLTTNGPTTVVPSEIQPTATTTPQTMQYEVVILDMSTKLDEFDNLSNEWEITKPNDSRFEYNEYEGKYILNGNDFEMQIGSEYEDEGYDRTSYNKDYTKITHQDYGDAYRVQNDFILAQYGNFSYFYVDSENFKTVGNCGAPLGEPSTPAEAPCGDGLLGLRRSGSENLDALFNIICISETESGLQECDKIVTSLRKP